MHNIPGLTVRHKKSAPCSALEAKKEKICEHFDSIDVPCERVMEWPCADGTCVVL
jgi:hypothetical protein